MKLRHASLAAIAATMLMISSLSAQDDASHCGDGADCCDLGSGCGSTYADVQLVYLSTHGTEDYFARDIDDEAGYRLVLGYEGCSGLGVRFRWFDFDSTTATGSGEEDYLDGLDLEYYDFEVTDTICICNWNGIISGGFRHVEYDAYSDDNDGDRVAFNGDGVTLGIQLDRYINCDLSLFAWLQHSMLYGDDEEDDLNTVMGWTEVQLGVQYAPCSCCGYNPFVRAGVEAQRHEGMFERDTSDTGLIGWFVTGGVNF